jgi:endonuclease YncB( thermonuclease family)
MAGRLAVDRHRELGRRHSPSHNRTVALSPEAILPGRAAARRLAARATPSILCVFSESVILPGLIALCTLATSASSGVAASPPLYRIDHVSDGDTVVLRNGERVRLVQIDTPEVFFGRERYGRAASLRTQTLLPRGTRVRLLPEPATDRIDQYGRLLRYVVRVRDSVNVNIRLVAVGAAAPYFYRHRRGRYANRLEALAKRARARKLGLWRVCPRTPYNPYRGIATRR